MARTFVALLVSLVLCATTHAAEDTPSLRVRAPRRHDNPRLKLSYRSFAIRNVDGTALWLNGAQVDAYLLSRRWVRLGVELEGGAGNTDVLGSGVHLAYGLVGLAGGFQYPARVTPFVEGRAIAGVLHAQLDGSLQVGAVTLTDTQATTYLYGGGVETGVEIYTVRRLYLSLGLGWVRTTWRGVDPSVSAQAGGTSPGTVRTTDLTGDSFTFKIGVGI